VYKLYILWDNLKKNKKTVLIVHKKRMFSEYRRKLLHLPSASRNVLLWNQW